MNINLLKESGVLRVFRQGDTIYKADEEGRSIFILLKGFVQWEESNRNTIINDRLDIIREGNIFGEMALIDRHRRFRTVIAGKNDTIVLEISSSECLKLLYKDSEFAYLLLRTLVMRIQNYMDTLLMKDPAFVYQYKYSDTFQNTYRMDKATFSNIVTNNPNYPQSIVSNLCEIAEILLRKNIKIHQVEDIDESDE